MRGDWTGNDSAENYILYLPRTEKATLYDLFITQSLGLLSAKSLRQILRIKIYTDVNSGLYLAVLPYKHDLLFSNVCGLNLCLARPLNIAAH